MGWLRRFTIAAFAAALIGVAWSGSAAAAVLWVGDGEQAIHDQWAEFSTTANCGWISPYVHGDPDITRPSSPRAQGLRSLHFTIRDSSSCYGERTELGQDLPTLPGFSESRRFQQGDDRWIAFQVRLTPGFPVNATYWQVIAQWKQIIDTKSSYNGCSPVLALQVHGGRYWLERADPANPCGSTIGYELGAATPGTWQRFTLHIIFKTQGGTLAVYNGTGPGRMEPVTVPTLASEDKAAGAPVPSHARIGIYRAAAISGTTSLTFDGYTVATTRAAAEANAYS